MAESSLDTASKRVATRVIRKIASLLAVLFIVSLATVLMLEFTPGDPVVNVLGDNYTPERYAEVRSELGLDRPLPERYLDWISHLVRGDFGQSVVPPVQAVSDMLHNRLPVTLELSIVATLLALLIAIPVGIVSAYRADGAFDRTTMAISTMVLSVPPFLVALALIFVLVFNSGYVEPLVAIAGIAATFLIGRAAFRWGRAGAATPGHGRLVRTGLFLAAPVCLAATIWLTLRWPAMPRQGYSRITEDGIAANLRSIALPSITLALGEAAILCRVLRTDMLTTLREDFVLAARAKGLPTRRILIRHALRPSSFSLLTVAGISLGRLIGGAIVVEQIFRLPGVGTMLVDAITRRDYAVVQGTVVVIATFFVLVNALVDGLYAALDPRVRRSAA